MREPLRILMLAANPVDRNRLALTEEYRLLRGKMFDNIDSGSCDLRVEWAARAADLKRALRETQPHIVHFSGHGGDESISLEDDERKTRPLSKVKLELLFNSRNRIRVVLLNACYSARQAENLSELVDFVIGTTVPIADAAALRFTNHFYRAIATGGTVREAFSKAKANTDDPKGHGSQYEMLVRPGADETTPLLPPSASFEGTVEVEEEIRAKEMNLAAKIIEGDPGSLPAPSPNDKKKMHLKTKRVTAGTFNFAGTILKQPK